MSTVCMIGNVGLRSAPYATERHLVRSFQALGWTVQQIPEGPRCERNVRAVLPQCDLVWYVRTHGNGWDNDSARDLWADCRRRGTPTVGFHLDRFVGIERRDAKVSREYALFDCDLVATADGDDVSQAAFDAAGIEHIWLPPAIVHDEVGIALPRDEYLGNVGFVGSSRGYHPEWPRRRQLVEALENRYPDLVRAGDGVTVREWDLNSLYASVKVCAGDSLALAYDQSRYVSDRLFECPGRGGILVHPPVHPDLMDQMEDAVVWADDWTVDSEIAALEMVLDWSDEQRVEQRQRAVEVIGRRHTYSHRIRAVLDHLGMT